MGRLSGQVAVITGAGSGIGLAVTERFVAEGARVVAVLHDSAQISALPRGVVHIVGDVTLPATHRSATDIALDQFGQLDCHVANAGVWDFHKRLEKIPTEDLAAAFDAVMKVNVLALLLGAQAALPALRQRRGSIIATASNAALLAGGGGVLYTASKFAVRGAIMQLATEFAPDVRVNAVAPGATDTALGGPGALNQAARRMNADAERMAAIPEYIPLRRVAAPEEHAGLYVTLASREESAFVTGSMFVSDGGITISI